MFQRYLYSFLFRKKHNKKLDLSKIKKVLFFRHDRLGDLLVNWPFIKLFQKAFPNIEIHMMLSDVNRDLLKYETSIRVHTVPYQYNHSDYQKVLIELKAEQFDLLIDPFYSRWTRILKLIRAIEPKFVVGLEKEAKHGLTGKDLPLYEISVPVDYRHTLSDAFRRLYIEITNKPITLEQYYKNGCIQTQHLDQKIGAFVSNLQYSNNILLLNVSGFGDYKCLNAQSVHRIAEQISTQYHSSVVITGMPAHIDQLKKTCSDFKQDVRFIYDDTSILDINALIRVARAVLTVDTSIVHLAELSQKPIYALYIKEKMVDELFLPSLKTTEVNFVPPLNLWEDSDVDRLLQCTSLFLTQHLGDPSEN